MGIFKILSKEVENLVEKMHESTSFGRKSDLVRLHSTGNLYVIRMKEFQGELRKAELLKYVFDEQISEERLTQREKVQTREQNTNPKRKGDEGR